MKFNRVCLLVFVCRSIHLDTNIPLWRACLRSSISSLTVLSYPPACFMAGSSKLPQCLPEKKQGILQKLNPQPAVVKLPS